MIYTNNEINAKLVSIINNIGHGDIINEFDNIYNIDIINTIGFDSLDLVELIMHIEKEFNIVIPDDHVDDFENDYKIHNINNIKIFLRDYGISDIRGERLEKLEKIEKQ